MDRDPTSILVSNSLRQQKQRKLNERNAMARFVKGHTSQRLSRAMISSFHNNGVAVRILILVVYNHTLHPNKSSTSKTTPESTAMDVLLSAESPHATERSTIERHTRITAARGRVDRGGLTLSSRQALTASPNDFSTRSRDLEALKPRKSCMKAENCKIVRSVHYSCVYARGAGLVWFGCWLVESVFNLKEEHETS